MVLFSAEIQDIRLLRGISAAREHFNESSRKMIANGSDPSSIKIFERDEEYVEYLIKRAAEHFATKYIGLNPANRIARNSSME
jgi:hypothetical protein